MSLYYNIFKDISEIECGGLHLIRVNSLTIPTMDDVEIKNKKVLLRVDINSPVDKKTGKVLDDSRIKSHIQTIKELLENNASITILSHQGRPGDDDFISLNQHAELLSRHLGHTVEFVEDIIGPYAIQKIKQAGPKDVLLLENIRMISEEIVETEMERQARTFLVKKLAPLFNLFINDAFAASHRSQPSLVGFPYLLPSAAGRVMEKEVSALSKIFNPNDGPKVFVMGGGKIHDSIRIIENLSRHRVADRILLGGLVSVLFAAAKGLNLGKANLEVLEKTGATSLIPRARKTLLSGAPLEIPLDFKTVDEKGEIRNEPASKVENLIKDVGETTVSVYSSLMKEASVIVLRGPMGVIEDERFREGTIRIMTSAMESKGFVIVGGGHMISMLDYTTIDPSKTHVSTGGGALLLFLAGEKLPAIEALSRGVQDDKSSS
ncbi:phosphoglycerate kinase [Sulfolobales archaeon HS-7]|nr:phosphoglycerate kinase [Sulfolobales archaeon HS-7]